MMGWEGTAWDEDGIYGIRLDNAVIFKNRDLAE